MNKLRKALNYYQDISKKRAYFPNNVLNWQLLGKVSWTNTICYRRK